MVDKSVVTVANVEKQGVKSSVLATKQLVKVIVCPELGLALLRKIKFERISNVKQCIRIHSNIYETSKENTVTEIQSPMYNVTRGDLNRTWAISSLVETGYQLHQYQVARFIS